MTCLRNAGHAEGPRLCAHGAGRGSRFIAGVMVASAPTAALGARNVSPGFLLFVAALPVVLPRVWAHPATRRPLSAAAAAVLAAPVLTWSALGDPSRSLDADAALGTLRIFASGIAVFCILVWGREVLGDRATGLLFGVGAAVQGLMIVNTSDLNAWKYVLAYPTALILLALVEGRRATFAVLLSLAVVSVAYDYRSFIGVCLLALMLYGWSQRPRPRTRSRFGIVFVAGVFAAGVYKAFGYLAGGGYLGSSIQARTNGQAVEGRSLLVAGRPEWAGAWELFRDRPLGYGPGVTPNLSDIQSVKSGLANVGASTSGEYVDEFMLGRYIELHSVLSDLWVDFGPIGLVFGVLLATLILRGFAGRVCVGGLDGLTALIVAAGVWHLGFAPRSGLVVVVCAAAFMVAVRGGTGSPSARVDEERRCDRELMAPAFRATRPASTGPT